MSKGTACRLASGMPLVLAGNMAYAAAQWLALVVLARWTTADAVGHYALALAVCGPVILFCNVQLAGLQSTDPNGQFTFQQYFGLRLITTALALSLILGVAVAANFDATTVKVLALLAVGKCAEAVSDVVHGALLRRRRCPAVQGGQRQHRARRPTRRRPYHVPSEGRTDDEAAQR